MTAVAPPSLDTLVLHDPSTIPAEPPPELLYHHKVRPIDSLKNLWKHREIVYTLAERDFRAQYKQATLGVLWAVISPVLMLLIMIIIFKRVKSFGSEGLPYALYAFVGILCWNFFSNSLGNGGQSLLSNKALLAKTQFPRECFPLENMCVSAINTVTSWIPLAILFVIFGRAPAARRSFRSPPHGHRSRLRRRRHHGRRRAHHPDARPGAGPAHAHDPGPVRHAGDLALLEDPNHFYVAGGHVVTTIGAHGQLHHHLVGGFTINLQMVYGFFNPVGPVIDQARWTLMLGHSPSGTSWRIASLGAVLYLYFGYRIFKRLEVNFADIA